MLCAVQLRRRSVAFTGRRRALRRGVLRGSNYATHTAGLEPHRGGLVRENRQTKVVALLQATPGEVKDDVVAANTSLAVSLAPDGGGGSFGVDALRLSL